MPVVDMEKYVRDLDGWISSREMKVYYRDTDKAVPSDADGLLLYQPGAFVRAGFLSMPLLHSVVRYRECAHAS